MTEKEKKPTHSPEYVRVVSERVYRLELARSAGGSDPAWRAGEADRMIAKYNEKGEDGPARFSRNAGQYDALTRSYLEALGIEAWQPFDTAPKDGTPILAWEMDDDFSVTSGIDLIWWDDGWLWGGADPAPEHAWALWRHLPLPMPRKVKP